MMLRFKGMLVARGSLTNCAETCKVSPSYIHKDRQRWEKKDLWWQVLSLLTLTYPNFIYVVYIFNSKMICGSFIHSWNSVDNFLALYSSLWSMVMELPLQDVRRTCSKIPRDISDISKSSMNFFASRSIAGLCITSCVTIKSSVLESTSATHHILHILDIIAYLTIF